MNAIKLPVKAVHFGKDWSVIQCDNTAICATGNSETIAKEIALSLNCHDALVETVEFYAISPNAASDAARAALAKVEDLRKKV